MKQRVKQGYDVYNLDAYFLQVFIPALKQLKASQSARTTSSRYARHDNKRVPYSSWV